MPLNRLGLWRTLITVTLLLYLNPVERSCLGQTENIYREADLGCFTNLDFKELGDGGDRIVSPEESTISQRITGGTIPKGENERRLTSIRWAIYALYDNFGERTVETERPSKYLQSIILLAEDNDVNGLGSFVKVVWLRNDSLFYGTKERFLNKTLKTVNLLAKSTTDKTGMADENWEVVANGDVTIEAGRYVEGIHKIANLARPLAEFFAAGEQFTISSGDDRITSVEDNGLASFDRLRQYRLVKANRRRNYQDWNKQYRGETFHNINSYDVDVSNDVVTWYHLYGAYCNSNFRRVPQTAYDNKSVGGVVLDSLSPPPVLRPNDK